MKKVYLLLRNNQQSGPFTLEELIQLGLKPTDLIWVEGRSASWSNPSELKDLQPFMARQTENGSLTAKEDVSSSQFNKTQVTTQPVSATKVAEKGQGPKYIYVSFPANTSRQNTIVVEPTPASKLEQKAEELRRRALAYSPGNAETESLAIAHEKPYRTLGDMKDEYNSWIHKQESKKKRRHIAKILLSFVGILILLAAGYFIMNYNFPARAMPRKAPLAKPSVNNQPIQSSKDQPVIISEEIAEPPAEAPRVNQTDPVPDEVNSSNPLPVSDRKKISYKQRKLKKAKIPVAEIKAVEPKKDIADISDKVKPDSNGEIALVVQEPEKKKSLGQKLNAFFKKFKRKKGDEKPGEESQKPVTGSESSETRQVNNFSNRK